MRLLSPWFAHETSQLLVGRQVTLRPPAMEDFEGWASLRLRSRQFLEPWEPSWDDRDYARASFRNRIRHYRMLAEDDTAYSFFLFCQSSGVLVGAVTMSNIRRGVAQMGSLGYWIGEPFQRHGYMTDAILTLLPFAFGDLALHRVEAACLPRNAASLRLLRKCGFAEEGLARSYLKIAGKWEDHVLFAAISNPDSQPNART
jgi:[ribosomal protein S5]-alanine N-acetyltransferase